MKKILKIIIPFALMTLFIGTTFARADYNVNVGDVFNYEVVKSNWNVSFGTNSSTGTGFEFEDDHFPVGEAVDIEVTAATASDVDWEMTVGTKTDTGTSNPFDALLLLLVLVLPVFLGSVESSAPWNQTEIDKGPGLTVIPFVDPDDWSDLYFDLSNETVADSMLSDPEYVFTNVGGAFDNSSSVAVFEWHFDATFTNATLGVDFGGTYTFMHAFDKYTGHMKGMYFSFNYAGTIDSTAITYQLEQLIEEVGYNLPGAGGLFPGFEWFLAIPALGILALIPIVIRKRK